MPQSKLSALGQETTFTLSDLLVKVKNSGGGDVLVTLANFLNAAGVTTRRAAFTKTADGANGATIAQSEANEISFTGTPTGYGRLDMLVPMDYVAGTNATINLMLYSANTNNQAITYFVGSHTSGASFTSWNVQNNQTTAGTINLTANTVSTFAMYTINSANLTAGGLLTAAFRPNAAVTGTIWVQAAYLAYTAKL